MPALHSRKVENFLQILSARVKEIFIDLKGRPKWGGEKSTTNRPTQNVHMASYPF